VAKAFIRDMRSFHAAPNAIQWDEIASRQLHALRGRCGSLPRLQRSKLEYECSPNRKGHSGDEA